MLIIMPKYIAALAFSAGEIPADFIITNSLSDSMRLYTNKTAAKAAIGDSKENNRGINSDVNSINKLIGKPLLVINCTKRNDCVSHKMANSEKLISRKPINICFNMYLFNIFIKYFS